MINSRLKYLGLTFLFPFFFMTQALAAEGSSRVGPIYTFVAPPSVVCKGKKTQLRFTIYNSPEVSVTSKGSSITVQAKRLDSNPHNTGAFYHSSFGVWAGSDIACMAPLDLNTVSGKLQSGKPPEFNTKYCKYILLDASIVRITGATQLTGKNTYSIKWKCS